MAESDDIASLRLRLHDFQVEHRDLDEIIERLMQTPPLEALRDAPSCAIACPPVSMVPSASTAAIVKVFPSFERIGLTSHTGS